MGLVLGPGLIAIMNMQNKNKKIYVELIEEDPIKPYEDAD